MATARSILKTYFELGKKPTKQQFEELIDALVHVDDNLSNVLGALANINEAQQGVATDKYMSAFLTKVAIDFQVKGAVPANRDTLKKIADVLDPHLISTANPHSVTKSQIGLGNLPNAKSNSTNLNSSTTLATSRAVNSARLANLNLINSKQNKSNAVKFYTHFSNSSPTPSAYNKGDIVFVGNPVFGTYIHNGVGWHILN